MYPAAADDLDQTMRDQRPTRPTRTALQAGPVLAAVHERALAAAVAERAGAHARDTARGVVLLALVPLADADSLGPGGLLLGDLDDYDDALAILAAAEPPLEALGVPYQVELRGYLARGGPRRQARRIAATVLRVAAGVGAEVIATGRPPGREAPGTSVATRVANGAAPHVRVLVASPVTAPAAHRTRRAVRAARTTGVLPADPRDIGDAGTVILTRQGRRLLAERARQLRARVLPELRAALDDRERDGRVDADYGRALDELRRLSWLVRHAARAEDLPDDPQRVELGELVTVRVEGGPPERFLIVHPVEAPLDDLRISADSPLARALLGRRVGERVTVPAPAGTYRCQILAAERVGPAAGPG